MNDNEGIDLFILERFDLGVAPKVFCDLQERIQDFCKANRMVKHVDVIQSGGSGLLRNFELYAMHIKSPSFLVADRFFIDAKYLFPDESMVIVSSHGCDKEKHEYYETHDLKGMELAVNNISAFKFFPIYETSGDPASPIIGSQTIFVNESDFGGSIPKWLVQKLVPMSIHDLFEDVVVATKNMQV
jgi:hypothetical protein